MSTAGEQYILRMIVDVKNDKALAALNKSLKSTNKSAAQVGKQIQTTNKALVKATPGMKRMNYAVQNASYQFSDLAVQIQGGVDPMRALSQQLPQLLGPMGMIGAAVGVVAALLPTLILGFRNISGAVEPAASSLEDLDGAISTLGRTMSGISLDGWVEEFNKATKAQREFMVETFKNDKLLAERSMRLNSEQFGGGISFEDGEGQMGRMGQATRRSAARRLEEYAKSLGLTAKQLKTVLPLYEKIEETQGRDVKVVEQLRSTLIEYNAGLDENNEKLNEQIDSTWELVKASRSLAESEKVIAQASAAGGSGTIPGYGDQDGGKSDALKDPFGKDIADEVARELEYLNKLKQGWEEAVDPLIAYRREMDELTQVSQMGLSPEALEARRQGILQTYEEAVELMNKAEEDSTVMADKMAKAFDQSFNAFVNGVAAGTAEIDDLFENMVKSMLAQIAKLLIYKAIFSASGGGIDLGGFAAAKGAVIDQGGFTAFAKGGVVGQPTLFGHGGGMGLMGEAGPEMIAPIRRMPNGDMGVGASPVNVVVNNNAAGVEVQAVPNGAGGLTIDVVRNAIAADLANGGNIVSDSLSDAYGLNRGIGAV